MNYRTMNVILTFAAVCGLGNTLNAQSYKIAANIPFNFHAGASSLAAGEYVVEKPFESEVQSVVSPNGHRIAVALAGSLSDTKNQSRLVFNRYGNEYFLSEIWNGGGTGTKLRPSKAERAMQESVAANRADKVTVIMASLR